MQTDKSQKSRKYQPLNMKEIQLQHSARVNQVTSQDYANILREKQMREFETHKKRSSTFNNNQRRKSQEIYNKRNNVKIQGEVEQLNQI